MKLNKRAYQGLNRSVEIFRVGVVIWLWLRVLGEIHLMDLKKPYELSGQFDSISMCFQFTHSLSRLANNKINENKKKFIEKIPNFPGGGGVGGPGS